MSEKEPHLRTAIAAARAAGCKHTMPCQVGTCPDAGGPACAYPHPPGSTCPDHGYIEGQNAVDPVFDHPKVAAILEAYHVAADALDAVEKALDDDLPLLQALSDEQARLGAVHFALADWRAYRENPSTTPTGSNAEPYSDRGTGRGDCSHERVLVSRFGPMTCEACGTELDEVPIANMVIRDPRTSDRTVRSLEGDGS